jgi:LPS export ABC transporter protein LptC
MRRAGQYVLGLLFVLLVVQVVILAPKTVDEPAPAASNGPITGPSQIDQAMHGVHLLEGREKEREWELWSDEALSFRALDRWKLKDVKVIFFGKNGVHFTVTGKTGVVETKTKNMKVEGNVVTRSSNGYVFKSETVEYLSHKRLLFSPTPVAMTGPADKQGQGLVLNGQRMELDVGTSLMTITGNVQAEKDFAQGKRLNIRSRSAQFSGKSKLARFYGNVIMDIDTMRITGPEAEFAYDASQEMVTSVLVKNGVRVSDLDKWATSDNLEVNFLNDSYVFQGKPRVVQNNDELVGEKIVFLDGGKRVQVEGARARMDQHRLGHGSLEKIN